MTASAAMFTAENRIRFPRADPSARAACGVSLRSCMDAPFLMGLWGAVRKVYPYAGPSVNTKSVSRIPVRKAREDFRGMGPR